ncbi:hypothetical protein GKC32_08645 [Lactobacillus curvatus]|uniref:hypothetical protein n=1 Tax=Latilactobacillus fragifolii TaxID=2814244 RepID=UPI0012AF9224|nr:hypothetical protein [Latilactobacillus fragifolii]MSD84524.1 hypothetical protein [Latilactobacillus curvatus]MSE24539.1 hypothetical protein [Latilactobacillus curvatus]
MAIQVGDLVRGQSNDIMSATYIGKVIERCEESVHILILNYAPTDRYTVHELMQRILVDSHQLRTISLTK